MKNKTYKTSFSLYDTCENFMLKTAKIKEEFIKTWVSVNALPEIKGEVTAGKMKWRGVKIYENIHTNETYIMQRGKKISPSLKIEYKLEII